MDLKCQGRYSMKKCKQCGQVLEDEAYRKYAPRGKGIYKTEQGYHTICKECENINNRALQLEKDPSKNQELYNKLVDYYTSLDKKGLGIASAVAGRYLAKDKPVAPRRSLIDKLDDLIGAATADECETFIARVRERAFADSGEAWSHYDRLKTQLNATGLRDEAARLIDIWEGEEQ